MCNFNLISYCKGIVLFQSNCVILLLLSEINCVNVNVLILLLLHGDIESKPGPKKKEQTYFSLCHWNVNSLVAHKKYLY